MDRVPRDRDHRAAIDKLPPTPSVCNTLVNAYSEEILSQYLAAANQTWRLHQ
jgi:hypothetical protein